MHDIGNAVAAAVIKQFEALPKKAKPRTHEDGHREWIPLSGIVLHLSSEEEVKGKNNEAIKRKFHCVALGYGVSSPRLRYLLTSLRALG